MYLNCKSYFSFRYGTFSTTELIQEAVEVGATTLALTNINNTCDLWDFVKGCEEHQLKPVAGVEIRNDEQFMYILLAKNNDGLLAINQFLTRHLQEKLSFPSRPVFIENVFIIYSIDQLTLPDMRSNEKIGVQPTEINKLFGLNMSAFAGRFVIRQPVTF